MALEGLGVLLLIVLAAVGAVELWNRRVRRLRLADSHYELTETKSGGLVQLWASHPDGSGIALGDPFDVRDPNFDTEIETARADARARIAALNSGQP